MVLKRKTPLKPGAKTKAWQETKKELKKEFAKKGIISCEVRLPKCQGRWGLSFAHRHKRSWYLGKPKLLGSFKQVVLTCIHCHQMIEYDRALSDRTFNQLRGEENE